MQIAGTSLDALAFWRPEESLEIARDLSLSIAASAVRGWRGRRVARLGTRASKPMILYEKEPCPFSRLVRESLSMLDLDAEMRPCPRGELAHRAELVSRGGQEQIPFLIDPNTGEQLYDVARIVPYLFERYGDGRVPSGLITAGGRRRSKLASRLRGYAGDQKEPARRPDAPLELYGYEAGPHTRLVREQLSTLALPWISRTRAIGSPRRATTAAEIGHTRFPVLHDPNTGRTISESDLIRAYLTVTYGR